MAGKVDVAAVGDDTVDDDGCVVDVVVVGVI
jgi:hypothetical protein